MLMSISLLSRNLPHLPPPDMFSDFTFFFFFISPRESVVALWIQSSRIYEKPLNVLQFWRRGGEEIIFSIPLILSMVFIYIGTHPPYIFPYDLYSSKFPLRDLMTWVKYKPNQGRPLIGWHRLCLIRMLTPSHVCYEFKTHIKRICRLYSQEQIVTLFPFINVSYGYNQNCCDGSFLSVNDTPFFFFFSFRFLLVIHLGNWPPESRKCQFNEIHIWLLTLKDPCLSRNA